MSRVYTASFSAVAVSAAQDLLEIVAPAKGLGVGPGTAKAIRRGAQLKDRQTRRVKLPTAASWQRGSRRSGPVRPTRT